MLGAIIGDLVGSTRELNNVRNEDFELLPSGSHFTDDTVMTLAVAKWLIDDCDHTPQGLVKEMLRLGRLYPDCGYGDAFRIWLSEKNPKPYSSYGNGSAMRVSPVGLYADSLDEALTLAEITASVSHNHPEGVKGAQAVAACVYMSKLGEKRASIKKYVEDSFGYELNQNLESIRQSYLFDPTCQGSVPQAIMAYLRRDNAESALRLAISIGGDSDTIGCITCAIANAYAPEAVSKSISERCEALLTTELRQIMHDFENKLFLGRK